MASRTSVISLCIGALCIAAGLAAVVLVPGNEAILIALILALLGMRICAREIGCWLSDDGEQRRL